MHVCFVALTSLLDKYSSGFSLFNINNFYSYSTPCIIRLIIILSSSGDCSLTESGGTIIITAWLIIMNDSSEFLGCLITHTV